MTFLVRPPGPLARGQKDESRDPVIRRLKVEHGTGLACSYKHDGFEDIAVVSTSDSEIAVADFQMRGEFFWMRLEGGLLKQVFATQACNMDRNGRSIFRRPEPGPYLWVN